MMQISGELSILDGPDYLALDRIAELCPGLRDRLQDEPDAEAVTELFNELGTEIQARGWPCLAAVVGLVARWPKPHRPIFERLHE